MWIPGHIGTKENEITDQYAKAVSSNFPLIQTENINNSDISQMIRHFYLDQQHIWTNTSW